MSLISLEVDCLVVLDLNLVFLFRLKGDATLTSGKHPHEELFGCARLPNGWSVLKFGAVFFGH